MLASSVAPSFRHLRHRLSDPVEFGIAVSGANLAVDFLAPQGMPAVIEQFQSPDWALDFHQLQVKARVSGPLEPGWASLGLMRCRTESSFHGFAASPGLLICNPPGEGIDGRITPGFECTAVSVPQAVWERCRVLAGVDTSAFGPVTGHQLSADVYAAIERRLHATHHLLRAANTPEARRFAARAAADFATELATLAWQLSAVSKPDDRDSIRNRARLARRAETWMRDHLAEPLPMSEICLALRVSRRELEYAFRASFDASPRDFLQALRLNAVRRALRHGAGNHESVSRVALDHGITHFGRFAAHYRALFGESPSATRKVRLKSPVPPAASLASRIAIAPVTR